MKMITTGKISCRFDPGKASPVVHAPLLPDRPRAGFPCNIFRPVRAAVVHDDHTIDRRPGNIPYYISHRLFLD
jgi:hypothetical protein